MRKERMKGIGREQELIVIKEKGIRRDMLRIRI